MQVVPSMAPHQSVNTKTPTPPASDKYPTIQKTWLISTVPGVEIEAII